MARIVAIIPARMGSSRFPGKPLASLRGKPMIEHVYRRTAESTTVDYVYVATCDKEIRSAVTDFGGRVIMTAATHERATDRVAEAIVHLESQDPTPIDLVVMVQGDEPMITSAMIDAAISPFLEDRSVACVNLVRRIVNREDYLDRNTIKVVMDVFHNALYFSRSPIPLTNFDEQPDAVFKQVCVIPFRRNFLRQFASWQPTPLEKLESIDMLRILENGGQVRLVETQEETHAVDTVEDLRRVEKSLSKQPGL